MIDFSDITKNLLNGDNMGGIMQIVYFGLYDDVDTWPTKTVAPTTLATAANLTGDLEMKAGKKMYQLYLTDDTGEFKCEMVGEIDGHSFVYHLSVFHPGMQDKVVGFLNAIKNENLVFIMIDSDGQKYVMGDALRPAILASSPDGIGTGKTTAARKGVSMEFTAKTPRIHIYTGNIPLTESI